MDISWTVKPDPTAASQELARSRIGRKARGDGTAETPPAMFPMTGGTAYSPRWLDLKREAGCNMKNGPIAPQQVL